MTPPVTSLSKKQGSTLERIAEKDPMTKIIGWHWPTEGPLLIHMDGTWAVIDQEGRHKVLVPGNEKEQEWLASHPQELEVTA